MANWCSTEICITSKDIEGVNNLHKKLKEWMSESRSYSNIVKLSGIATYNEQYHECEPYICCRGTIMEEYIYDDEGTMYVYTETAWGPLMKLWYLLCDKYLPNGYQIIWRGDEDSCGVHMTNDPDGKGKYFAYVSDYIDREYLDILENLYEKEDEFIDEKEIVDALKRLFSTDINDIDKLIDMIPDSDFADYISIYPYEYIENYPD